MSTILSSFMRGNGTMDMTLWENSFSKVNGRYPWPPQGWIYFCQVSTWEGCQELNVQAWQKGCSFIKHGISHSRKFTGKNFSKSSLLVKESITCIVIKSCTAESHASRRLLALWWVRESLEKTCKLSVMWPWVAHGTGKEASRVFQMHTKLPSNPFTDLYLETLESPILSTKTL